MWSFAGARAETSARVKGAEGYETEGVRGLKALGVRDLQYRLAFLACTVTSSNPRVSVCVWGVCLCWGGGGLKAFGVRDLQYRLAFLACTVTSSNPRVSVCGGIRDLQYR